MGSPAAALPPVREGCSGGSLPPLGRGPCSAPRFSHGVGRGGSKDCSSSAAMPTAESSEGPLAVCRSGNSGSSRLGGGTSRTFANDFQWTLHSRDLPLDVRPIVEDNKMLQEELRRYRQRFAEQEGAITSQDRQILLLRDDVLRLQRQLKECSVAPAQLLQEQQFQQLLQDRDASIQQLQQKVGILEKAKQAAEKRLGNDLAAERRQQAELRRKMKQLQEDMAEKQRQARFNQLHINQLYKRLEPLEAAVAAAAALPATPLPPPPPPPEPEERVQLMLCMVYAQPQPTAQEIAEAAAKLAAAELARQAAERAAQQEQAATRIQAAFRGFQVRLGMGVLHAAATTIQAQWRGVLAREAVAPLVLQRQASEAEPRAAGAAATLSLADRMEMRRRAAERQYRERAAAAKNKPQKRLPARHSISGGPRPPSSLRTANTAPEAAARQRNMLAVAAAATRTGEETRQQPAGSSNSTVNASRLAYSSSSSTGGGTSSAAASMQPSSSSPNAAGRTGNRMSIAGAPSRLPHADGETQGMQQGEGSGIPSRSVFRRKPLTTAFGSSSQRMSLAG